MLNMLEEILNKSILTTHQVYTCVYVYIYIFRYYTNCHKLKF